MDKWLNRKLKSHAGPQRRPLLTATHQKKIPPPPHPTRLRLPTLRFYFESACFTVSFLLLLFFVRLLLLLPRPPLSSFRESLKTIREKLLELPHV